jgi:oligopeptide/dipeptide ABC transporter ATP-binding protein
VGLLEVTDLTVSFQTSDGVVRAVRGVSFGVDSGRTLGIVGESGSGKSVAALSLLGLVRGADISGRAVFEERSLLDLPEPALRSIRGARIGMVFQDPLTSLHPQYRIGWQIVEMIRAHRRISRQAAHRRAVELLRLVGIPRPERRVDDYPHQFSGGMRQRAMIAMALALDPVLLIADEPTTALDATVQAQILTLLRRLQHELGTAIIMISHDLGVIAELADEVVVMYAGRVAEVADRRTAYYHPHHPYTLGLLASVPASAAAPSAVGTGGARGGRRLRPIPGQPPSLIDLPGGCAFHPRCRYAMEVCRVDEPALRPVREGPGHRSACWLPPNAVGTTPSVEAIRLSTQLPVQGRPL